MPNQPATPKHGVRVPPERWDAAMRKAQDRGETLTDAINKFLERYGRDYDPDYAPAWVRDVWERDNLGEELAALAAERRQSVPNLVRDMLEYFTAAEG